jgi:ATP-dependent DNA helicase RecG
MTLEELATAMNLCEGAQEHLFPKNVGLLMFSENPKQFFPGVQIDVVEFPYGVGAKEFNEKTFDGAIQIQLTNALSYIQTNILKSKIKKYADRAEADKIFNYPYEAIEESLANAVYHRNYELREPIEVRVLPEAIEIISYNGIDPSLKQADFEKGIIRIRRYRNRRIGGFLKELELTEGRGTGIPTIIRTLKDNGSPAPVFDTDEPNRSYFVIEIPIHPDFMEAETHPEDQKERLVEGLVERLVENDTGVSIGGAIDNNGRSIGGSIDNDGGSIQLTIRQKEILSLIAQNAQISIRELARILEINHSAVDKHIESLKLKGVLNRIGGTRGYWQMNTPKDSL